MFNRHPPIPKPERIITYDDLPKSGSWQGREEDFEYFKNVMLCYQYDVEFYALSIIPTEVREFLKTLRTFYYSLSPEEMEKSETGTFERFSEEQFDEIRKKDVYYAGLLNLLRAAVYADEILNSQFAFIWESWVEAAINKNEKAKKSVLFEGDLWDMWIVRFSQLEILRLTLLKAHFKRNLKDPNTPLSFINGITFEIDNNLPDIPKETSKELLKLLYTPSLDLPQDLSLQMFYFYTAIAMTFTRGELADALEEVIEQYSDSAQTMSNLISATYPISLRNSMGLTIIHHVNEYLSTVLHDVMQKQRHLYFFIKEFEDKHWHLLPTAYDFMRTDEQFHDADDLMDYKALNRLDSRHPSEKSIIQAMLKDMDEFEQWLRSED